jgi:hypothetical protein
MPTGTIDWRGGWVGTPGPTGASTITYYEMDAVYYEGSSYICKGASAPIGSVPPPYALGVGEPWDRLAIGVTGATGVTGPTGTVFGQYGSFYSTQNQPLEGIDTPQVVTLNGTYVNDGVTVVGGSKITMANQGIYNFTAVLQLTNISNDVLEAEFWIKYVNNDYPNSATHVTMPPRKSSTEPSEQLVTINFLGGALENGAFIEIWWKGESGDLSLSYNSASSNSPAAPSVICSLFRVG